MAANRFFIWSWDIEPREFVPSHEAKDSDDPRDFRYFARILVQADAILGQRGLTFLVNWNADRFDSRFDGAIVMYIGDEQNQIPSYAPRAKAIFKTGGVKPNAMSSWFGVPFHVGWRLALRESRNRLNAIRRRARRSAVAGGGRGGGGGGAVPPMYDIPLGYYRLVDVPFVPFGERPIDAFFAGALSVPAKFQLRPSVAARADLARAVRQVEAALPRAKVDFSLQAGSAAAPKYDPPTYSRKLMESKIMLCPRGNIDETYRLLEAAKSGCVVISEPLPQRWYYQSLPAVQIRSWSKLVPTLRKLLSDPATLESLSTQTRQWWENYASERAVAEFMVKQITATCGQ